MTETDVLAQWRLGFILGAVVVLAVAVLLITILMVARKIASLAATALSVAAEIESATQPIWSLGDANRITEGIARTVQSVDQRVHTIADRLG